MKIGSTLAGLVSAINIPWQPKPVMQHLENAFAAETETSSILEANLAGPVPKAKVALIEEGPGNRGHKHYYTREVLERAVTSGKFEGKPCFINHPSRSQMVDRPERDVEAQLGYFTDVHIESRLVESARPTVGFKAGDSRAIVVGTFHPEVGNPTVMNKLRAAEAYRQRYPDRPGYIGWSIVAGGSSTPKEIEGEMWNVVNDFTEIDSIDMVTKAGAGGRLFALMESEGPSMNLLEMFGMKPGGKPANLKESDVKKIEKISEARTGLTTLVERGLSTIGVKPNDTQKQLIEAALGILPHQLMTPGYIRATLQEAGVEIPVEKHADFDKSIGADKKSGGELDTIVTGIVDAEKNALDVEIPEIVTPPKPADPPAPTKKPTESDVKDVTTSPEYTSLMEKYNSEKARADTAIAESAKSTTALRETNALNLLKAVPSLNDGQKVMFKETLMSYPTNEQPAKLKQLLEVFKISESNGGGAPPSGLRGRMIREGAGTATVSINAMRD